MTLPGSYARFFLYNEPHNIKAQTKDPKKNKALSKAKATINTTTQKQDNIQISWNLFLQKQCKTTKFLLFQKVYQVKLADLHYLCLLFSNPQTT